MASQYIDITDAQPTDGQQVWVRIRPYSDAILMYWRSGTQDFCTQLGDFTVTGAGTAGIDGDYSCSPGPFGSYFENVTTGNGILLFEPLVGDWWLCTATQEQGGSSLYEGRIVGTAALQFGVTGGDAPAPTVTRNLVVPWYLTARWRPQ